MSSHWAGTIVFGMGLALARPALATELAGSDLIVGRSPQASDCPDANQLVRSVLALWMAPQGSAGLRIEVHFDRTSSGHSAEIRSFGGKSGTRRLETSGLTCAPLADAVSVSLAVLLDLVPVPTRPEPRLAVRAASKPETPAGAPFVLGLSVGAGGGYGVQGRAVTGLFSASLVGRRGAYSLEAQAFWSTPHSFPFDQGFVEVGLWGGGLDGCYLGVRARRRGGIEWRPCAGLRLGQLSGAGSQFDANYVSGQAWVALAATSHWELALATRVRLILGLSLFVPLREHRFEVAGRGAAFESLPLGGVLQLGPELSIW